MITLKNNFHGTSVNLRPRNGRLSPAQMRRARRVLCGPSDCQCGGIRGPQEYELEPEPGGGARVERNYHLTIDRIFDMVDGDGDRESAWIDAIKQLEEIYVASGMLWGSVAKQLNVAPSTLYGWLDGRHEPSPLARNAIAGLLDTITS